MNGDKAFDSRRIVMITLVDFCNLDCVYCYEKNKKKNKMNFATAKKIIDEEMNKDEKAEMIEFDLFGGEPFLNFELIQDICKYLEENTWKKKWLLFATTNGTLLNDETKKWLRSKKGRVFLGLSLDGTPQMHNMNRSNSYSLIDTDFFLEMYPEQYAKMTISKNTIANLAEGIIYLHNLGFRVSANLAEGIEWDKKEYKNILIEQLLKLADFYLDNPKIEPCNLIDKPLQFNTFNKEGINKYCGTGTGMCSYDVSGRKYPCQFFMPLSVGEEKAENSKNIKFEENITRDKLDLKCQKCSIKNICATCLGANYMLSDNIYHKSDMYCYLMKTEYIVSCYFKYNQYLRKQIKLSQIEEIRLLATLLNFQKEYITEFEENDEVTEYLISRINNIEFSNNIKF